MKLRIVFPATVDEELRCALYSGAYAKKLYMEDIANREAMREIGIWNAETAQAADVLDVLLFDLLANFPMIRTVRLETPIGDGFAGAVFITLKQFMEAYPERKVEMVIVPDGA